MRRISFSLALVVAFVLLIAGCEKKLTETTEILAPKDRPEWRKADAAPKDLYQKPSVSDVGKTSLQKVTTVGVVNGGFEAGSSGWTFSASGYGINGNTSLAWIFGASDPNGSNFSIYYGGMPHTEPLAHSGNNGASAVENGTTFHRLYQDVMLPSVGCAAQTLTLEFWIRWKNQFGSWIPSNQDIIVTLRDPSNNNVLATLFQASALNLPLFSGGGNFSTANYELRTADITAYAGQTVRLNFENDVCCYFQYMDLDDIAVVVNGTCVVDVDVDVKPQSCPNPLNTNEKGVVPVAILGSSTFDVANVDVSTVTLEGVSPLRSALEDVATPFGGTLQDCNSCTTLGPDGFTDLSLKFDAVAVIAALGSVSDGECRVVKLTGNLLDGTPIVGEDVVLIRKKK